MRVRERERVDSLAKYLATSCLRLYRYFLRAPVGYFMVSFCNNCPARILYKSLAGRYQPVSYPDGPITARYRFIRNAYWVTGQGKV